MLEYLKVQCKLAHQTEHPGLLFLFCGGFCCTRIDMGARNEPIRGLNLTWLLKTISGHAWRWRLQPLFAHICERSKTSFHSQITKPIWKPQVKNSWRMLKIFGFPNLLGFNQSNTIKTGGFFSLLCSALRRFWYPDLVGLLGLRILLGLRLLRPVGLGLGLLDPWNQESATGGDRAPRRHLASLNCDAMSLFWSPGGTVEMCLFVEMFLFLLQ